MNVMNVTNSMNLMKAMRKCLSILFAAADFKPSTLTVIIKYDDTALSGIRLAVCRVADAAADCSASPP